MSYLEYLCERDGLNFNNFDSEGWYLGKQKYEAVEIVSERDNRKATAWLNYCPENGRWYVGYDFWDKDHGYCTGDRIPFAHCSSSRYEALEWVKKKWAEFNGKKYEIQLDLFGGNYE